MITCKNYSDYKILLSLRAHGWSREAEQHQKYVDANPGIDPRFIFVNLGYNVFVIVSAMRLMWYL